MRYEAAFCESIAGISELGTGKIIAGRMHLTGALLDYRLFLAKWTGSEEFIDRAEAQISIIKTAAPDL